ncbi:hypothetical protein D5018_03995 [Parashewanella curva]|uniref:Uncharacterized protein n=1 Tax=Parashewanella curva TaxID=2338552 RepID=A0A3L8Q065_9GAMM|nr:hypothetical protein [Parashewanella curva]RLV61011.1 hypothetical protein D5018_03995 [Parashewanella curva]
MLQQLKQSLGSQRQILKVTQSHSDGTVSAVSPSGHGVRVIGSGSVNSHIYVQDGRVLGTAPDLPHSDIEV